MKHSLRLIPCLLALAIGSAHAAVVRANAASDFALTQGNNGWNYGFAEISGTSVYRTSDFKLFSYAENIQDYVGINGWTTNPSSFSMITPMQGQNYLHMHPSDTAWSILRYNITTTGDLKTDFNFGRLNPHPSGSINARVYLNGQLISESNDIRADQSFSSAWAAKVFAGDKLDFIVDANGNAGSDSSSLMANVVITPVPEPETYALMGMGLLGMMAARRRKQK